MALKMKLKIVDSDDLDRIHESSLEIMDQTGIAFHSETARNVFKKHGARVDGEVVHISRKLFDQAMHSVPRVFKWHARNPQNSLMVGGEQRRTHVLLDHGPVFIQDVEKGRRNGTLADLVNLYRLGQKSGVASIIGQIPVDPSDIPIKGRHLQMMYHLLRNTDKPLMGWTDDRRRVDEMLDMIDLVMGRPHYLDTHPAIGISICSLSPLRYAPESCDSLIAYAQRRQPILVLSAAMAGITAPISLVGTVIQQNAEVLAGMVLIQLINPGTPFIYGPASSVPNMKSASYITSSPESGLINMIGLQLAIDLYGFPTRTMAGLTDSKKVDCQAGYETMQNYFTMLLSGTHLINECFGTLDGIKTVSYEKFIIDEEMLSRMQRILQGVDISDEDYFKNVSVINEIGRTGSYLEHASTLEKFRTLWVPTVADWDPFVVAEDPDAGWDVLRRANHRCREVLAQCPESLLDDEQEKALKAFISAPEKG